MPKFELWKSAKNDLYYWRFKAANGKTMMDSGEGYDSASNCKRAIARIKELIAAASIVEV